MLGTSRPDGTLAETFNNLWYTSKCEFILEISASKTMEL